MSCLATEFLGLIVVVSQELAVIWHPNCSRTISTAVKHLVEQVHDIQFHALNVAFKVGEGGSLPLAFMSFSGNTTAQPDSPQGYSEPESQINLCFLLSQSR